MLLEGFDEELGTRRGEVPTGFFLLGEEPCEDTADIGVVNDAFAACGSSKIFR